MKISRATQDLKYLLLQRAFAGARVNKTFHTSPEKKPIIVFCILACVNFWLSLTKTSNIQNVCNRCRWHISFWIYLCNTKAIGGTWKQMQVMFTFCLLFPFEVIYKNYCYYNHNNKLELHTLMRYGVILIYVYKVKWFVKLSNVLVTSFTYYSLIWFLKKFQYYVVTCYRHNFIVWLYSIII